MNSAKYPCLKADGLQRKTKPQAYLFLVTRARTRVPHAAIGIEEGMAKHAGAECQLQNSVVAADLGRGVGGERLDHPPQTGTAGSDDDLRDSSHRVGDCRGCLRKKTL